eukprot:388742_1
MESLVHNNKKRHKWMNQWIHKKCKNKHGRRVKVDDDSSDQEDPEICKKQLKIRDNIDYIQQYNDYTNTEMEIESQLNQMQISNIKYKWTCIQCTFINSKQNLFCTMCNTAYDSFVENSVGPGDITLLDFMPTIKVSKTYARNMKKQSMTLEEDNALLQIATQLSLESSYKNIQYPIYRNNNSDNINEKTFEKIIISMNNGEYGKLSIYTRNLFYKYNFLQYFILPKLKIINKNASDNYSKINVEFIVKEIALKRLNFCCNHQIKIVYVNHKDFPLLNSMKSNVLFNERRNEYNGFCDDSVIKLSGIKTLICGYLKFFKYKYVPNDVVYLIHLFCNLNPEQLLYKMDTKKNISYFKKRNAKIRITSATNDAIKILHYNRVKAVNKVYLCVKFTNKKDRYVKNMNDKKTVYSDILPILSISKRVKAFKFYGSNNYESWYYKRTRQIYPAYWSKEYAALFYQVEYEEFYGHN